MSYRRISRRNGGMVKPHARVPDVIFTRRAMFAGGLTLAVAGCGGGAAEAPTPAVPALEPTQTPEPVPTQAPIGSPVAGYGQPTKWNGRTLNVAAWGGNIEDAQGTAFFDPFEEATGASVQIKK